MPFRPESATGATTAIPWWPSAPVRPCTHPTFWDHQRRPPGRLFYGSTSCPGIKKGVGSFTADHIVAVLRALPDTDGTYAQVIAHVTEHGAVLSATTLGKWLTTGRADIEAGNAYTAYAPLLPEV